MRKDATVPLLYVLEYSTVYFLADVGYLVPPYDYSVIMLPVSNRTILIYNSYKVLDINSLPISLTSGADKIIRIENDTNTDEIVNVEYIKYRFGEPKLSKFMLLEYVDSWLDDS